MTDLNVRGIWEKLHQLCTIYVHIIYFSRTAVSSHEINACNLNFTST